MFFRLYSLIGLLALCLGLVIVFNVSLIFDGSITLNEVSSLRVMLALMSFNLAFTFPFSVFGSIISAYENFVFQKLVNIIRIVLNPLVMTVLLLFDYKAIAMVVVITIFNLLTLLMNCFYCFTKLKIKLFFGRFNWLFLKEISIYSLWIFLNIIMDRIYWSTGQFVLGVFKGVDSVAIYAVAIQLKTMFFMFATAISGVLLPKITGLIAKGTGEREISDIFIKTGRIQFVLMSFILSVFILFGQEFILLWAGENYQESFLITLLLFVPAIVPLIQNIGVLILQARNQMKFRSLLYLVISVVSIFIAMPFTKLWGGIGCALATSIALFVGQIVIMNIYYARKQGLHIIEFWRQIGKMAITPIVMTLLFYLMIKQYYSITSLGDLFVGGAVFSVVYMPLVWFFSLNEYERDLFGKPIGKILKIK